MFKTKYNPTEEEHTKVIKQIEQGEYITHEMFDVLYYYKEPLDNIVNLKDSTTLTSMNLFTVYPEKTEDNKRFNRLIFENSDTGIEYIIPVNSYVKMEYHILYYCTKTMMNYKKAKINHKYKRNYNG